MHHRMCPGLKPHEHQSDQGQHHLQPLRPALLHRQLPPSPCGRRPVAQMPNPRQHRQIYDRTHSRQNQHRNPNRILMKSLRRCVNPARCSQRGQPDGHTNSADCQHCRAQTLQQRHHHAHSSNYTNRPGCFGKCLFHADSSRMHIFILNLRVAYAPRWLPIQPSGLVVLDTGRDGGRL